MSEATDPVRQQREHIERLEAELAAANERDAASAVVIRENAMLRSNVDLESAVGQMFAKAYDGELDAAAIREAAAAVGALKSDAPAAPLPDPTPGTDELEIARQRASLVADATPGGEPPAGGPPVEEAYAQFHDDLRQGVTRENASGAVIGRFIAEANEGNPDFRYDAEQWRRDHVAP